jgi:hypothetical protein
VVRKERLGKEGYPHAVAATHCMGKAWRGGALQIADWHMQWSRLWLLYRRGRKGGR